MTLQCHDCSLPYGGTGWADFVVPNDIWAKISPTRDEGGILCVNCILRRLDERNITCEGKMTSGPCSLSSFTIQHFSFKSASEA